jgi:ferredoxin-NADP reductase
MGLEQIATEGLRPRYIHWRETAAVRFDAVLLRSDRYRKKRVIRTAANDAAATRPETDMKARLVGSRMIVPGILAFEVEPAEPFEFKAGQTSDIAIPQPAYTDDRGSARTFSITSVPGVAPLVFATRMTGSAFKRTLAEAPPGALLDLDGPYGSFTLHHNAARPAIILAGGIGITPFRSIIGDATRRNLPHRITLLYSNTSASSAAFLDDLTQFARENPNFHVVPTITAGVPGEPWSFETGRIDAAFVKAHVDDPAGAMFYIAGPAGFVAAMGRTATDIGADPDNIKSEEFPGY